MQVLASFQGEAPGSPLKKTINACTHLVMQGQGTLALSIVDACLHEAGVDLAA